MIETKDLENRQWTIFHPGGDGYLPLIGAEVTNLVPKLDPFNNEIPEKGKMRPLDAVTHFYEIHHPKFGSIKLVLFGKEL